MRIYTGLDLSRKRLDWHACAGDGTLVEVGAVAPDADGLARLVHRLGDADVLAVIEVMNGARFIHDQLELAGWDVRLADAQRARALAPLTCKTDRIDAWVLAELARRDLIPEVWLPDPSVRAERERARFRMHLVRHRTMLKNRIHQTLIAHGYARPTANLFTTKGRTLLSRLELPEPWQGTVTASLALIETLDEQIDELERELRRLGADHAYIPLLRTVPGIGWVLAYTIASEIGDITRFTTPRKLIGYTGLCPRVYQARPPRRPRQARPQLPALGTRRSRPHRRPPTHLQRNRSPPAQPPRPLPRQRDRRDHDRTKDHRSDLVDADPQPALCSGKRQSCLTAPTVPNRIAPPEQLHHHQIAHQGRDRGMSTTPRPRARDPDPDAHLTAGPPS
jgi:transposase